MDAKAMWAYFTSLTCNLRPMSFFCVPAIWVCVFFCLSSWKYWLSCSIVSLAFCACLHHCDGHSAQVVVEAVFVFQVFAFCFSQHLIRRAGEFCFFFLGGGC